MTVHVGEIASEVSAVGPSIPTAPDRRAAPSGPGIAEEEWADQAQRARWLVERTCAEGFGD